MDIFKIIWVLFLSTFESGSAIILPTGPPPSETEPAPHSGLVPFLKQIFTTQMNIPQCPEGCKRKQDAKINIYNVSYTTWCRREANPDPLFVVEMGSIMVYTKYEGDYDCRWFVLLGSIYDMEIANFEYTVLYTTLAESDIAVFNNMLQCHFGVLQQLSLMKKPSPVKGSGPIPPVSRNFVRSPVHAIQPTTSKKNCLGTHKEIFEAATRVVVEPTEDNVEWESPFYCEYSVGKKLAVDDKWYAFYSKKTWLVPVEGKSTTEFVMLFYDSLTKLVDEVKLTPLGATLIDKLKLPEKSEMKSPTNEDKVHLSFTMNVGTVKVQAIVHVVISKESDSDSSYVLCRKCSCDGGNTIVKEVTEKGTTSRNAYTSSFSYCWGVSGWTDADDKATMYGVDADFITAAMNAKGGCEDNSWVNRDAIKILRLQNRSIDGTALDFLCVYEYEECNSDIQNRKSYYTAVVTVKKTIKKIRGNRIVELDYNYIAASLRYNGCPKELTDILFVMPVELVSECKSKATF